MSPHYESDPAQVKIVQPDHWYEPPATAVAREGESADR
jgi:hypothetical protein